MPTIATRREGKKCHVGFRRQHTYTSPQEVWEEVLYERDDRHIVCDDLVVEEWRKIRKD